ncbi:MAG: hypothetical protein ACHQT8_03895, partial [Chlamydiales bacterium]
MIRNGVLLLLFLFSAVSVGKFCIKQTDGFTISSILSSRDNNPAWETRPLSSEEKREVKIALDKKYHYFGCGGQSYIFFSDDEKSVLKVFKQEKFQLPFWMRVFHIPVLLERYREKKIWGRKDKLSRDFTSYKVAFDELQEETGLVYVHLNKSDHLHKKITLIDRLNISHQVDLDTLDFVIQKRGELVYERITRLMQEGKQHEAKNAISQIIHLIVTRCQKGYHDRDPNIRTNCGFIEDRAVKIDVG